MQSDLPVMAVSSGSPIMPMMHLLGMIVQEMSYSLTTAALCAQSRMPSCHAALTCLAYPPRPCWSISDHVTDHKAAAKPLIMLPACFPSCLPGIPFLYACTPFTACTWLISRLQSFTGANGGCCTLLQTGGPGRWHSHAQHWYWLVVLLQPSPAGHC